ncbi:unnamed protein product [Nesidiocoris tenuis]|uniref:Uncharacterized protein n=1 Tax=Nesidiocoris tenuis TaxID=355587 RepID=A0A6H5HHZ9_9HEMI|nr:unnamed protein product [Nesidiocoris tenuis]
MFIKVYKFRKITQNNANFDSFNPVSHVRPFSSPAHGQTNVTARVGLRGERISQSTTLPTPHYLRRQRHDKTFDREIFAVSANGSLPTVYGPYSETSLKFLLSCYLVKEKELPK